MAGAGKKVDLLDDVDGDATFDVVMGGVTVTLPVEMPASLVSALSGAATLNGSDDPQERAEVVAKFSSALDGLVPAKLLAKHSVQRLMGALVKAYTADGLSLGESAASSTSSTGKSTPSRRTSAGTTG